jgi:hypothetical protein
MFPPNPNVPSYLPKKKKQKSLLKMKTPLTDKPHPIIFFKKNNKRPLPHFVYHTIIFILNKRNHMDTQKTPPPLSHSSSSSSHTHTPPSHAISSSFITVFTHQSPPSPHITTQ